MSVMWQQVIEILDLANEKRLAVSLFQFKHASPLTEFTQPDELRQVRLCL